MYNARHHIEDLPGNLYGSLRAAPAGLFSRRRRLPLALLALALLAAASWLLVPGPASAAVVASTEEFDLHSDNDVPRGVWGNDTTIWVAEDDISPDNKIYAYNRDGTRDSSEDFDTLNAAGNQDVEGIWSDGTTMFVLDRLDDKVYAYNMSTKARDGDKDIALDAANDKPQGIWGNDDTIWVSENDTEPDNKLYAYDRASGNYDSSKDFDTLNGAGNTDVEGIWSDGTTMWVLDPFDDKAYAFKMSDKSHDSDKDFDLVSDNGNPSDIWSGGSQMWVTDTTNDKLYLYTLVGVQSLHSDNDDPRGVWGDDDTVWVSEDNNDATSKLFAYKRSDGTRDSAKDFELEADNSAVEGIWSDGTTMFVVDIIDDKVYAYKMSDKSHDSGKDITMDSANNNPQGIWGNADTIWVAEDDTPGNNKVFAYKRSDGSYDSSKDFDTLEAAGNQAVGGIWSDGTTMWVANRTDQKLYAYKMSDQSRDAGKDIDLVSENGNAWGVWSDGETVYVVDATDDKLYLYQLQKPNATGAPAVRGPADTAAWSATLTAGVNPVGFGYLTVPTSVGSLSPGATFTLDGVNYTVQDLYDKGFGNDQLTLNLNREIPVAFTLTIDGTPLQSGNVADSSVIPTGHQYTWLAPSVDWSDGSTAQVSLTLHTDLVLGQALRADTFGISDADGKPTTAQEFTYQWVRVDGGDDTDIPGATAPFYYPTAADMGKSLKVRVEFEDGNGVSEGPLTSAASAAIAGSDSVNVLWSTTMTVGQQGTGAIGYRSTPSFGSIADDEFTYGDTDYTVTGAAYFTLGLGLGVSPELGTVELASWRFGVAGTDLDLDEGTHGTQSGASTVRWTSHNQSWNVGDRIALAMMVVNSPATGAPVISGTPQVGEALTAVTSGISDGNGLPDDAQGFDYQWQRSGDGGSLLRQESLHSDNAIPVGVWGNTDTVWVADAGDKRLYAYNRSDWSRKPAEDFDNLAAAGNDDPRGIWSDGATMFVVDAATSGGKLYAYKMSDKSHDSAKDITLNSDNVGPRGVWGNADTIWVVNNATADSADKIFAYRRSDGTHDTAKDFTTLDGAGNNLPTGIWSDGTTMWVADSEDDKLYAYRMSDRSRDTDREFDLHSDNGLPQAIWSDGTTMFVVDPTPDKVFVYTLPGYTDITGANAPDYYPTDADAGRHIRVQVSFQDGDDFDEGPINSVGSIMRGNVLAATLTAEQVSGGGFGYDQILGAFNPNTFSHQGTDYTVVNLFTSGTDTVSLKLSPVPDTADENTLALVIGNNTFPLSEAIYSNAFQDYSWANTGITWSHGQTVSISMEGDIYDPTADVIVQPSTTVSVPWSATVTVGEETGGTLDGFLGPVLTFLTTPFGALPDMDIDIVGQDSHSVVGVTYDSSGSGTLTLYVDLAFAGLVRLAYGADATLATTAATAGAEGAIDKYDWSPHGDPGWADGDRVAFAVVVNRNVAATGAPVVGGTYQTGQVLTADPSGITDPNGVTTAAFEYEWERVSCGTASDNGVISGETSSTYTVVAADLDCSLEVTVSFNDDDGYPEARSTTISARGGIDGIAVTSDPGADDTYAQGDWIEVSVTYNEAMTVSGTPRLELDIGGTPRQADYHAASSSSTVLVFRYRVGTTDLDADGISVSASKLTLNGGGLSTVATPVKDGSLFNPALAADSDHKVDGVAPTLVSAIVATGGQAVRIGFSEDIDGSVSSSDIARRFTLRRSDNSEVTVGAASFGADVTFLVLSDLSTRVQEGWTLTLAYDDPSGDNVNVVQDLAGNDLGDITSANVINQSTYVPNSLPTGFPTISGTVALNQVLTVDTSNIADANGLGAFSYQWSRTGCTDPNDDGNISGATGVNYTVVAADLDCVLKVTVTYTDDDEYEESLFALTIDFTLANWSLSRNRSSVTEGGTVTVTLRITNGHTYSSPVVASVYDGDTAVADGGLLAAQDGTHTITIPAGGNQGSVTLTARDDDLYNYQNGSTAVQLTARVGQQTLGSAVSLTVRDNEARPSITLSASGDRVIEGESITLTATAQPRYAGTMSVTLSHTDSRSVLAGTVPTTLEFAAESATAEAVVATENDDTEKLNARVTFTIRSPSTPGRLGSPRSVTLDWVDDDGPPLVGTPRDGLKRIQYLNEAVYGYRPAHGLRLYWWSVTGAVEYKLEYRKTGDTGAWSRATVGDFDQSPSITQNRALMGIAAGLECATSYDVRLSVRGARPDYVDGFGPYAYLKDENGDRTTGTTGPCPKPEEITNVVRTAEPDCFTITWTRPTNTAWTGYRVVRHILGPDNAEPEREVLHERVNDSSTRFRDCSNQHGNKYGLEDHSYIYDVQYLRQGASASELESAPRIFTPTIDSGGDGYPFSPRNLRLTTDTRTRRVMTWEAPPNHWLTAARALRGDLRRGNVTDPWTNGYIVERREYTGNPDNPYTIQYPAGSSWETVRVGYNDNTRTSYTDNSDRGTKLYVYRVRTTNPSGSSSEYTDDYLWDAPVVFVDPGEQATVDNNPATGAPTISGTARVDETITASTSGIADQDGLTNVSYSYQWVRGDADISGATARSYTLKSADQGSAIRVRVSFRDDGGNDETLTSAATGAVAAASSEPLTASFQGQPGSHDGQDSFTFELRFSEEVELSYLAVKDHALTVTGGDVTGAQRLTQGSNIGWRITVEPDSDADVTIVLPATTDCSVQGAVCTVGGKKLSAGVEFTVPGPAQQQQQQQNSEATGAPTISGTLRAGETLTASTSGIGDADGLDNVSFSYQWIRDNADIAGETARTYDLTDDDVGKTIKVRVTFTDNADNGETLTSAATGVVVPRPPLTASIQGQPSSHDGQADFTFELRFSEELTVSYLTLRDHAFTVTGGTVIGAQRLTQGSNVGWRITVTPDSSADVTVLLPVTTDCDASGAVCTGDGRMLSNRNQFTVSGP